MAIVRSFQCWPQRFVGKSARYQADFFMINSYIINKYFISHRFTAVGINLMMRYILLCKPHSNYRALFQYRASQCFFFFK